MTDARPIVVQTSAIPSPLLKEAHERGAIQLKLWERDESTPDDVQTANREWILNNVAGASALVVLLSNKVDAEVLDKAGSSLKVVSTMSVGYDHVDVNACKERGIPPDVLSGAVADTTLLLMLMITRHALVANRIVTSGAWRFTPMTPTTLTGPSLEGKTIGFLGFGSIAQFVVRRLLSFSPAKVLYTTSKPKPFAFDNEAFATLAQDPFLQASQAAHGRLPIEIANEPALEKMAAEVDVLVVLANYSQSTHHIVNASLLSKMKKSAYLVNIARGPLVDTAALVDALKRDEIAGAALDVIEGEPNVSRDSPILEPELADKVVLLPHIGSATIETRETMAQFAAQNALGALGVRDDKPDAMPAELKL